MAKSKHKPLITIANASRKGAFVRSVLDGYTKVSLEKGGISVYFSSMEGTFYAFEAFKSEINETEKSRSVEAILNGYSSISIGKKKLDISFQKGRYEGRTVLATYKAITSEIADLEKASKSEGNSPLLESNASSYDEPER